MPETKQLVETDEASAASKAPNDSFRQPQSALGKFVSAVCKSDIVLALILLVFADIACRVAFSNAQNGASKLDFDVPYRSRTWYAAQDFLAQRQAADVVLLGASDMACAVFGAEATYLNAEVSQLSYHRSQYLERRLEQLKSPYKGVFCLAIPGEMPSDAYFKACTLLVKKSKPKAIVFSVAPRSLCDATFEDASSTDMFKIMSKLGGTKDFELSCRNSIWDQMDYGFQQACSVYAHKWELTCFQHHAAHHCLSPLLKENFKRIHTSPEIRKFSLLELPEDYDSYEIYSLPYDPTRSVYVSNLAEYKSRYRELKRHTFNQQLSFLKKLGDFCRTEGIRFIVINTPVADENRALIPKPVYNLYYSSAMAAVQNAGGSFVNFDTADLFHQADFVDSIHLNGRGGLKFMDHVAMVLSTPTQLAGSARADCH